MWSEFLEFLGALAIGLLGGWLLCSLVGVIAGGIAGATTCGLTFFVLKLVTNAVFTNAPHANELCLAGGVLVGMIVFVKTFLWFSTLGRLLARRR